VSEDGIARAWVKHVQIDPRIERIDGIVEWVTVRLELEANPDDVGKLVPGQRVTISLAPMMQKVKSA